MHWLLPVLGYAVGAIPFGVLIARAKGVDLFKEGSGNVGATNVGRVLGRPFGALVFILDFLKGALPTWLAIWLRQGSDPVAVLTGLACILGHMFSPALRFRGGKGVATGAGAVLVLLPAATGLAVLAFAATILAGCTMSLASIAAAVTLAGASASMSVCPANAGMWFAVVTAALVLLRHRSNMVRLYAGTEARLNSLERLAGMTPAVHALSLALWFGGGCLFSFVIAPGLFATFGGFVAAPPDWFAPVPAAAELGSRLAGVAVGPIFPHYYIWQSVCGAIAAGTAVGWTITRPGAASKWRAALLVSALILVAVGWPVARHVSALRLLRYEDEPGRVTFAAWHVVSLLLNLATLALVAPAMALAGCIGNPRPGIRS